MSEWYGISEEDIFTRIECGENLSDIARSVQKNRSVLSRWLAADEQRSARARTYRALAAAAWDEKAQQCLEDAGDAFELSKAKELAHHYRWRASKVAPKEYGDKTTIQGDPDAPLVYRKLARVVIDSNKVSKSDTETG